MEMEDRIKAGSADFSDIVGTNTNNEGFFENTTRKHSFKFSPSKQEMLDFGFRASLKGASAYQTIKEHFGVEAKDLLKHWKFAYNLHGKMYVKAALFQNSNYLREYLTSAPTITHIIVEPNVKRAFWSKNIVAYKIHPEKFRNRKITTKITNVDYEEWLSALKSSYKVQIGGDDLKSRVKNAMQMIASPVRTEPQSSGIKSASNNKGFEFDFGPANVPDSVDFTSEEFQTADMTTDSIDFI